MIKIQKEKGEKAKFELIRVQKKDTALLKIYLICRRGFRLKTTKTLVVIAVVVCLKSLSSISDLTNDISDEY